MKPSAILCGFLVAFVPFVLTVDRASAAVNNTGTRSNTFKFTTQKRVGTTGRTSAHTKIVKHPHRSGVHKEDQSPLPRDR